MVPTDRALYLFLFSTDAFLKSFLPIRQSVSSSKHHIDLSNFVPGATWLVVLFFPEVLTRALTEFSAANLRLLNCLQMCSSVLFTCFKMNASSSKLKSSCYKVNKCISNKLEIKVTCG